MGEGDSHDSGGLRNGAAIFSKYSSNTIIGDILLLKIICYLKFRFNWAFPVFINPALDLMGRDLGKHGEVEGQKSAAQQGDFMGQRQQPHFLCHVL